MGEPMQDDANNDEGEVLSRPDEAGFSDLGVGQQSPQQTAGTGMPSADEGAETGGEPDEFLQDEPGPPDPPD